MSAASSHSIRTGCAYEATGRGCPFVAVPMCGSGLSIVSLSAAFGLIAVAAVPEVSCMCVATASICRPAAAFGGLHLRLLSHSGEEGGIQYKIFDRYGQRTFFGTTTLHNFDLFVHYTPTPPSDKPFTPPRRPSVSGVPDSPVTDTPTGLSAALDSADISVRRILEERKLPPSLEAQPKLDNDICERCINGRFSLQSTKEERINAIKQGYTRSTPKSKCGRYYKARYDSTLPPAPFGRANNILAHLRRVALSYTLR
ncbi:hypothetical protein B0J12DRAFT_705676 [Macrophomina phaseolina]|uniref:Uncharacterized protein n=1 Tax=Macrophomina phaseolina TaxID=35725 RepID=A0ABQ8FS01_9PEZI|nr:hypothetical protein B0J12DRAFT_705676 [Macrophomina phaseolina]